ncbi:winged helix-turn-helix domain-containing tetratricopeptide repeat protein [Motiliproteus sp.]|uniref:winged helix-turn-helix domain-containing tetratricopeptide repeat protein n=1 Tax=Motiliproteus sp. TaxID=1898955 RepID=UPI003BAAF186
MRITFADIEIDTERFELRRASQLCQAEPKVFDLLLFLIQHQGQIFDHDALIEQVWNGRPVAETTISTAIKQARRLIGDDGSSQRFIQTLRGRGYRFEADVHVLEASDPVADTLSTRPAPRIIQAAPPVLMIMPLRVLTDQQDAVKLAQTLPTELATLLGRIPLLQLGVHPDDPGTPLTLLSARAVHEAYGADYLLEGTLLSRQGDFRLQAQLIDARSGFQRWGEQFFIEGPFDHAVEQAPLALIAKLEPQMNRAITEEINLDDPDPQRLFLAAHSLLSLKGWRHEAFEEAATLLRRSRRLAPEFALAPALLSLVMGFGDRIRLIGQREQTRAEALEAAQTALELDDSDSTVLGYAGCAIADIGDSERALPILRQAVELNSVNAQAWVALGSVNLINGELTRGIEQLQRGISLSPLDSRLAIWGTLLTLALLKAGQPESARQQGLLACQRDARSYLPRLALAAAELLNGAMPEAAKQMRHAYRIKPGLQQAQVDALVGRKLGAALTQLHG